MDVLNVIKQSLLKLLKPKLKLTGILFCILRYSGVPQFDSGIGKLLSLHGLQILWDK